MAYELWSLLGSIVSIPLFLALALHYWRADYKERAQRKHKSALVQIDRLEKLNQKLADEYETIDNPRPLSLNNNFLTPALWDKGYYRYSPHASQCKCHQCSVKNFRKEIGNSLKEKYMILAKDMTVQKLDWHPYD